MLVQF